MASKAQFSKRQIGLLMRKGVEEGLEKVCFALQAVIKTSLSQPGTGEWYKTLKPWGKGTRMPARSSAPGFPPAAQTGYLRNMWFQGSAANSRNFWYGTDLLLKKVSPPPGLYMKYAQYLEEGTSRMKARPYLAPSIKYMNRRGRATLIFSTVIKKYVDRINRAGPHG